MKIAAQGYTVRDFTKTPEEIEKTIYKLKEIGYDAMQISAFGKYDPLWLKGVLDKAGMQVCVTHTWIERILKETDDAIAEHKLLGIPYIGLGGKMLSSIKECDEFIREITPAVNKIADSGLKFLYHNHAHEFIKEDGKWLISHLLNAFPAEKFGLILDTYWAQVAGVNVEKFIRDNKGRIPVIHFKDRKIVPNWENANLFAEIFEGNMDFDGIYQACIDTGIEWAAVEQDVCDRDPFDSLKISLENMKRHNFIFS